METTKSRKRLKTENKNGLPITKITEEEEQKESKYVLYGYNAHYGWQEIETNAIHKSLAKLAMENKDQMFKVPAGARKQIVSDEKITIHDTVSLRATKRDFRISSPQEPLYGSCQWIAAAMLIHEENQDQAQKMIELLHANPDDYNWKMMYKGKNSLSEMLSKSTPYRLMKVRFKQHKPQQDYIQFLLTEANGRYVCLLQDTNYSETHVVGIDCSSSPKLILDCAERHALELSKDNLDRCVGENNACKSIRTVGEIVL